MDALIASGAETEEIAILSMYKGQLKRLRTINRPEVTVATVDSSQGNEYPYVIVDLVTPAGMYYPLGFLGNSRRACVALSRDHLGMVIIGNRDMGNIENAGGASAMWDGIINDHMDKNAFSEWSVEEQEVQEMKAGNPSPQASQFAHQLPINSISIPRQSNVNPTSILSFNRFTKSHTE